LSGALLGWCLFAAATALRQSASRTSDSMAALEAEFLPMIVELPPAGEVGYLEPYGNQSEDDVRMHYAAQYALVPRIIAGRVGPEFLIVARGMARPDGDPRLAGYHVVASFPGGHRLFRRLVP
jgi:hypothetical protein